MHSGIFGATLQKGTQRVSSGLLGNGGFSKNHSLCAPHLCRVFCPLSSSFCFAQMVQYTRVIWLSTLSKHRIDYQPPVLLACPFEFCFDLGIRFTLGRSWYWIYQGYLPTSQILRRDPAHPPRPESNVTPGTLSPSSLINLLSLLSSGSVAIREAA